jgi:FMN phosphatase YigB (HAD superfamily)
MPKAIFIDWDGTLSNSLFWERWSKDPIYQSKYASIQKVLFRDSQDLLYDWMRGFRSTAFVVSYVSDTANIPYDDLINELRYSCENMEFIDRAAIDMIQSVREKGTKVIIATDNMDAFRHWTMPSMQIDGLFDGVLISDTIGALKAEMYSDGTSLFFHHYLSQNNIKPHETVLIDNSLGNKVVEKFGMNFLHVNPENTLTRHLTQFA